MICIYHDSCIDGFTAAWSSKNGGVDVSKIAKKYGGGGHRNAAGFKVIRPMVL